MDSFTALGDLELFAKRLAGRGIIKPTEIQTKVIPSLLKGDNVLFRSPTGTGKTFAYLLPLLQRLLPLAAESQNTAAEAYGIQAILLIIAPTQELCSQIKGELDFLLGAYPKEKAPRAALIIGSANIERQIQLLKKEKPQIVIGNPARLLLLAHKRRLHLQNIKALVLDEGDFLVADEILEEIKALLRFLPKKNRQNAACSATISARNRERLLPYLGNNAVIIETEGLTVCGTIEHWAFFSEKRKKNALLRSFLAAAKPKKTLVFCSRGGEAGNILSQLQHHHFAAGGIWSDMSKGSRKAGMDDFRAGKQSILVASDLACRGLDIQGISHVVAMDIPENPELYLHRSGRTGRTGRRGIMVSIGDEQELRHLSRIEKKLGITVFPKMLYGGRVLAADSAGFD